MKIALLKLISKDQLSKAGDIPKWVDSLLEPLNQFIEKAGQALQGQLTFSDNFLCKEPVVKLVHAVETEVNPYTSAKQKTLKVRGVLIQDASGVGVDGFKWSRKTNGNIGVTVKYDGGVAGQQSNCTLLILLG